VHIVIFSGGPKETDAPWSTAWKLAATAKSWIWNNFVQNYPEEPGWLQNYWEQSTLLALNRDRLFAGMDSWASFVYC
jgi:hypothetical protein